MSGHVEHDLEGCWTEKYSFQAHYLGDGSVHGNFNVRDFFTDGSEKAFAKGRVTCFAVEEDGKTTRMGDVVESSSCPIVGTEAIWTVRDDGDGENEPREETTDLIYGFPLQLNVAARQCDVGIRLSFFTVFGQIERMCRFGPE